jgi:DNA-binding NarL/FixJ family response regulator
MIRVLVAADIRLYREGLRDGLDRLDDIAVVAAASTTAGALEAAERARPEVAVVDLAMVGGVELLRDLGRRGVKLVALTVPEVEEAMLACAEAGVVGYLGRDGTFEQIVHAIRGATQDEVTCEQLLLATLVRAVHERARADAPSLATESTSAPLTERELEVARLIAFEGLSNKQIAQRLCIELPTVKNHVHNVLAKLGVNGRSQAAARLRDELDAVRTN